MVRKQLLVFLSLMFALVALVFVLRANGAMAQTRGPQGTQGTAFTYQGRLIRNGQPVSDTCDMQFYLWDAATGGSFLNSNWFNTVPISNGLFTVQIDFGSSVFNGDERWLETLVRCTGDASHITLSPRTRLTAAPYAIYSLNSWALNGNSGTNGNGFIGTTDNVGLSIGVNNAPALRIYPHSQGPNIVGGYSGNYISPTLYGQTIAGGGSFFYENRTMREYGTVGGGRKNQSDGYGSTIAGGIDNKATNDYGVVAGGLNNQATGSAAGIGAGFYNVAAGYVSYVGGGDLNLALTQNATIGGGYSNTVTGGQLIANNTIGGGVFNYNSGFAATIAGGHGNQATGEWSSMGGGGFNTASTRSSTVSGGEYNNVSGARGTIGGGAYNVAAGAGSTIGGGGYNGSNTFSGNRTYGTASTIGGGYGNVTSADAGYGVIGGGQVNQITATAGTNLNIATIGGGYNNRVTLGGATIGGGNSNTASGFDATVGGGNNNTASGGAATVPGGNSNLAGGFASFAAGYRAKAYNNGCFAWNDNTDADLVCNTNNTFVVRSTGGVIFGTNTAMSTGCSIPAGGGGWACSSDRNVKTNFTQLDGRQVLDKLNAIPIQAWTFKTENPAVRHIGPTAQDFYAAFGLGEDDTHINSLDADGVSLAAIQGLYQIVQEQDTQIAAQQERIDELEQQNTVMEARLTRLEQAVQTGGSSSRTAPFNPFSLSLVLGGLGVVAIMWVRQRSR